MRSSMVLDDRSEQRFYVNVWRPSLSPPNSGVAELWGLASGTAVTYACNNSHGF